MVVKILFILNDKVMSELPNPNMSTLKHGLIEFIGINLEWYYSKGECTEWIEECLGSRCNPDDWWDYNLSNGSILFDTHVSVSHLSIFLTHWNKDFGDCQDMRYKISYG
jgi:hypothetical protein